MQASPLTTLSPSSPSFSCYSSGKLAEIAARVVQEFTINDQGPDSNNGNIFSWNDGLFQDNNTKRDVFADDVDDDNNNEEEGGEKEEFEFAFFYKPETEQTSLVSADDIFYNGKIMPVYPLFDTNLLFGNNPQLFPTTATSRTTATTRRSKTVRSPLRKLFNEEKTSSSSSSSLSSESGHQDNGLESLPPGTYCVWAPKKESTVDEEEEKCKIKSNSTGSSKRWKLRDLLYRSNSDGKETFMFLAPSKRSSSSATAGDKGKRQSKVDVVKEGKGGVIGEGYVRRRGGDKGGGDAKRRSFLPYRQDLVGFFSNVHGLNRNLNPF